MSRIFRNTSGGKAISGGALAPRSRRNNTLQVDSYFRGGDAEIGDFDSIATLLGTGSSATISFTSIPATYKHLQIRFIARVADTDVANNQFMQFNSDTGANYSWHLLEGDGAAVSANGFASESKMLAGRISAATAAAGIMGVGIVDILDYADTNKYKTIKTLSGQDRNGGGVARFDSGNWRNTAAITSIQLINSSTTNYTTDSQFALYGIKG